MEAIDLVQDGVNRITEALKIGRFTQDHLIKVKKFAEGIVKITDKMLANIENLKSKYSEPPKGE